VNFQKLSTLAVLISVAVICMAAGPCAPTLVTPSTAAGSSKLNLGLPSPLGVPSPTPTLFGGPGYLAGGGTGFVGPNPQATPGFSGGTSERFNAVAVYPSTSASYAGYIVAAGKSLNPSGSTVTLIA
jgi:hypothetical protein